MCGIFGILKDESTLNISDIKPLALHARQRGVDASGMVISNKNSLDIFRADASIDKLLKNVEINETNFMLGHSRLVTNGFVDNQPVYRDNLILIHNGIVANCEELWINGRKRKQKIDSEIIAVIFSEALQAGKTFEEASKCVFNECEGVVSAAIYAPNLAKLILISNNGSLYVGTKDTKIAFSSEEWPLLDTGFSDIDQIKGCRVFDVLSSSSINEHQVLKRTRQTLVPVVPEFLKETPESKQLVYDEPELHRCSKCILPSTMPFIRFDAEGVCNYCNNYVLRNKPKPLEQLIDLLEPYKRKNHVDCIVPFSGGRDSCMALHLIQKELKMKSVAYTYDWGMVTDLGRRNISRFCASLGVENIIVAANIEQKRKWIKLNLEAWLKKPHLGMVSLLTAGDKHFFRYVEQVKKQTGVGLNIWGVNPLEVTHFKAGFLGIPPGFEETKVYSGGFMNQLRYQKKRYAEYVRNPSYINSSMYDTLSGEYWRSIAKKEDYFHMFDYYTWNEEEIDGILEEYNWEKATDTPTTWRIGDGTAAFYNYIYYTVAGFTEHDTFRSNQIREGALTRDEALKLVRVENRPRYPNIKWYLDAVNVDYNKAISIVNKIPKIYEQQNL
jgi:glutamine---fructose-6-phosphate transaminase (isomerizing)